MTADPFRWISTDQFLWMSTELILWKYLEIHFDAMTRKSLFWFDRRDLLDPRRKFACKRKVYFKSFHTEKKFFSWQTSFSSYFPTHMQKIYASINYNQLLVFTTGNDPNKVKRAQD